MRTASVRVRIRYVIRISLLDEILYSRHLMVLQQTCRSPILDAPAVLLEAVDILKLSDSWVARNNDTKGRLNVYPAH